MRVVLLLATFVSVVGCRAISDAEKVKPELSAECQAYVERAEDCIAANSAQPRNALQSVYSANKVTLDAADTEEKMQAATKDCTKWSQNLDEHPRCR